MKTQVLVGTAVAALLAGYPSTSSAQSAPPTGTTASPALELGMGMLDGTCPMQVAGTTVTSKDIEGGVAIVFTTSAGNTVALRERVQRMAERHNHKYAGGGMMMADHAPGNAMKMGHRGLGSGMMKGGGMRMPAATAAVEDIDGGARLVLRPKAPTQLEALREHARMRADRLARGDCPMMSPDAEPATAHPTAGNADRAAHR